MEEIYCKSKKRDRKVTEEPHIVRDFMIGNTRIKIADDCCRDKTLEDVQKILREIAQIVRPALTATANATDKG